MLRLQSHDDMMMRLAQRAAFESMRERDVRERASRCGRVADDISGFEDVLAARLTEAVS
jgi:hypothetical protein